MEREDLIYIQERIQYNFKKSTLLQQAFIRRSYSKENPKWQDNEILELIGDSELGAFIIRKLCKEFGRIDDDQFYCNKKEGDLTKLKSNYVSKESLAHCIEMLGFNNFLIMGKADRNNNVQNESDSVKEDLFEAIIGAVAVDSGFDRDSIDNVCTAMLGYIDFNDNYIEWVKEWCEDNDYSYEVNYYSGQYNMFGYYSSPLATNSYTCRVTIRPKNSYRYKTVEGKGKTKELAEMSAAKEIYYNFCEIIDMRDIVGEPDFDRATNQLNELYQKGYISKPEYIEKQEYNENDELVWHCDCKIDGYDTYYWAENSRKKDARKNAAEGMLKHILKYNQE